MKSTLLPVFFATLTWTATIHGQVPSVLSYQGHLAVNGNAFNSPGEFKFALVDETGTETFWSNDGSSVGGAEPASAVILDVHQGYYSVLLGDLALPNMTPIPPAAFGTPDVHLRIWFNHAQNGFQQLVPDQIISSVGYAMMAADVPDGIITTDKLADDGIDGSKIAPGTITASELAPDSVNSSHVIDGEIHTEDLADHAVTAPKIAPHTIDSSHIVNNSITSSALADVVTLQRLNLGGINWDGSLYLYAQPSGGGGGLANPSGVTRGHLLGDEFGSEFGLYQSNGKTGAVLNSRAPGGRLQLWDGLGTMTTLLGSLNGGGDLNLFQISGDLGVKLNGDRSTYSNQNSSGGEITVHTRGGQEGLLLDGDHNNAGRIEVRQANKSTYVDIFGRGSGESGELRVNHASGNTTVQILGAETRDSGALITLRRANNVDTIRLDAEAGTLGGGQITVRQADGDVGAILYGSAPNNGAGALSLRDTRGTARFRAFGGPESGSLHVYGANGTETFEVVGSATANTGSELRMRNASGNVTVEADADWSPASGGNLRLFKADGSESIRLQADYNGSGRIIADVIQINGADLSERFDITTPDGEFEPGMLVCIDPDQPGHLVLSTKAYDRTAAGVLSGAGGVRPGLLMGQAGTLADGAHPVALTGRVYCHVDASRAPIEPGDLITTSDVPGHGMKVTDHARAQGAIIGKAMTGLESGRGQVLLLVSLQ